MTPDQHTIKELIVKVGNNHQLYVQEWGNKSIEIPIVFLHGGPGSGCNNGHKSLFDPIQQRVIFFDQRGCGHSRPFGSIKNNSTADLVDDIETIADKLGLSTLILTGSSWGSCLALAYSLKYPKRLKAMVLSGIFTGSESEINYLKFGGWAVHFPETWDNYLDNTPVKYQANPSKYHYNRILNGRVNEVKESAYICQAVETALLKLDDRFTMPEFETYDPTPMIIETFYMANDCFMDDRYILDNTDRLKMPIWLIQGRYDMICPPVTAYELNHKLTNSHLIWTMAGHANDRPNYDAKRNVLLQMSQTSSN